MTNLKIPTTNDELQLGDVVTDKTGRLFVVNKDAAISDWRDWTFVSRPGVYPVVCDVCEDNQWHKDKADCVHGTEPSTETITITAVVGSRDTLNHFLEKVEKTSNGCWLWTKGQTKSGYGKYAIKRRAIHAHRASWILHKGPIDDSRVFVCHRCDVKLCVNPDHLFLGSPQDNMTDMAQKGRSLSGERNPNKKLSLEDVDKIRGLLADGMSLRKVATLFAVSDSMISNIKLGRAWVKVEPPKPITLEPDSEIYHDFMVWRAQRAAKGGK